MSCHTHVHVSGSQATLTGLIPSCSDKRPMMAIDISRLRCAANNLTGHASALLPVPSSLPLMKAGRSYINRVVDEPQNFAFT